MKAKVFFASLLLIPQIMAADPDSLDEHLAPFKPWLGKTWKGHFKNSTPEKPQVDIIRWERALNGKAVRVLHSVNDGAYGGETMILWDAAGKQVKYFYFTTAGFNTTGTMTFDGSKVTSHETVLGSKDGITEVRATTEIRSDGTFETRAEYYKNGQWVPGHQVLYREDAAAKVIFR